MKRIFVDPVILTIGVMVSAVVVAFAISVLASNSPDSGIQYITTQYILHTFVSPIVGALATICFIVVSGADIRIFGLKIRRFILDIELDADPDIRPAMPTKFDDGDAVASPRWDIGGGTPPLAQGETP